MPDVRKPPIPPMLLAEPLDGSPDTLRRLIEPHRRLVRFVDEQLMSLGEFPHALGLHILAVLAKAFQTAGGRIDHRPQRQLDEVGSMVQARFAEILPLDAEAQQRAYRLDIGQPWLLGMAVEALRDDDAPANRRRITSSERASVVAVSWVCLEALHAGWEPDRAARTTCLQLLIEALAETSHPVLEAHGDAVDALLEGSVDAPGTQEAFEALHQAYLDRDADEG